MYYQFFSGVMLCIHCKIEMDCRYKSICDNSCGTEYCNNCNKPFYFDTNKKIIIAGHNPKCGDDDF